jgi:hypothetical protein
MGTLPGALAALPWTFSQAASLPLSLRFSEVLAWVFTFSTLGLLTLVFCRTASEQIISGMKPAGNDALKYHSSVIVVKYFFLPIFCSLPVYIVAPDFGRWFAVACINYSMMSVSREINYTECAVAKSYKCRLLTFIEKRTLKSTPSAESRIRIGYIPTLLILLFAIFYIRLPHCCIRSAFLAEPLRSLARNMLSNVDPFLRQ